MDVLQFALEMELEGERYYRRQSEKYATTPLKTVFDILSRDEAKHAEILRKRMDGTAYELKAQEKLSGRKNLFTRAKGLQTACGRKDRSSGIVPCCP